MLQVVDIGDFPRELERAMLAAIVETQKALKLEAAVECGDHLAQNQQFKTGRLSKSTAVSGRHVIPHDPGAGFHTRASRTEIRQSARATIPHDKPGDPAHVTEAAGAIEGKEYLAFVEARFPHMAAAIKHTEGASRKIVALADKTAERALVARGFSGFKGHRG